jgi:hypothetical protein
MYEHKFPEVDDVVMVQVCDRCCRTATSVLVKVFASVDMLGPRPNLQLQPGGPRTVNDSGSTAKAAHSLTELLASMYLAGFLLPPTHVSGIHFWLNTPDLLFVSTYITLLCAVAPV